MANPWFNWTTSLSRFVKFDAARAEEVNTALDEVSTAFDGVETKTKAALKLPDGETAATLPAPASRMGKVLGFNATTGAVEATLTADQIANAQGYASDALSSKNAAAASQSAAASSQSAAAGSATAAQGFASNAASSAALCSSTAINTLNSRTYFFFTM